MREGVPRLDLGQRFRVIAAPLGTSNIEPCTFAMRLAKYLLLGLLSFFSVAVSHAAEGMMFAAQGDSCKSSPRDQESGFRRCEGPNGFGFTYFDHATRGGLAFGSKG